MSQRRRPLQSRKGLLTFAAVALLAMTAATAQVAAAASGTTGLLDDSGSYRQEVQACNDGRTAEDRATCLREAGAARAARLNGRLDTGQQDQYQANAKARCEPLSGEYKAACEARVMGFGSKSGSVAGGGVLHQVETVVVPPGSTNITVEPKTDSAPVLLVPLERK